MAEVMLMPKLSDTMTEGVIANWLIKVGEKVSEGDIIAEVESDKATMEVECYEEGTLLYIGAEAGDSIPVNGVMAIIGEEGEDFSSLLEGGSAPASEEAPAEEASAPAEAIDVSGIDAQVMRMPKLSDTMTEGVIANWLINVGDTVNEGDIIAEVESDKATMEVECYEEGTLLYIGAEAGGKIPVDGIMAIVGAADADYKKLIAAEKAQGSGASAPAAESKPAPEASSAAPSTPAAAPKIDSGSTAAEADGRVKASPLAKKLAADKGYKLSEIKGSGPGGRVVKSDVENFTPAAAAPAPAAASEAKPAAAPIALPTVVGEESYKEENLSQMRKVIARRLSESKFQAPHFYVTMEINMDKAIEARKSMNEISPVKISFNDMVVKATAVALRKNPAANSMWLGDKIRYNDHVHIGVAVAIPDGLVVPTIKFADSKTLSHLSAEVKELAGKAKNKTLGANEMEGSTFTISNLGMFGVEEFTAIVNPPAACIMAVGGIKQTPVVKDGQIVPGNVMKVTLSADHRVVDGAVAAAFLKDFKGLLEDPVRILI